MSSVLRKLVSPIAAMVVIMAIGMATPARADLELMLSDTVGNSVTTAASVGTPGFVNFSGDLSGHGGGASPFTVNVTTGLGMGTGGAPGSTATDAIMDLNSVNVSSSGAGTLTILLTQTGFTDLGLGGTLSTQIGGTMPASASLTAQTFKDDTNTLFGVPGTFHSTLLSFTASPFSGSTVDSHGPLGTYSMTEKVVITFTASGTVSFDYEAENVAVPEPSTFVVGCIGALGMIGYGLRRRKARGV